MPFQDYINAAVLIAQKVQTTHVAQAEPAAARTWAQTAAADAKLKKRAAAASADGSHRADRKYSRSDTLSDNWAAMPDAMATAVDDFSAALKVEAVERSVATFLESLGRCPLCAFVPEKGMLWKDHKCLTNKMTVLLVISPTNSTLAALERLTAPVL